MHLKMFQHSQIWNHQSVSGDGYIWKYLFTVSPSDIIKFDSTDFIAVPNDWTTTNDASIQSVRENGDSDTIIIKSKKFILIIREKDTLVD